MNLQVRRGRVGLIALVAGGLCVLPWSPGATAEAAGAAAPRTIGFDYVAPSDCPDAGVFATLVASETGGGWRLAQDAGEPRLSVQIVDGMPGKIGRLRGDGSAGGVRGAPRQITAPTCTDVVRALALTAALALDQERERAATAQTAPVTTATAAPGGGDDRSSPVLTVGAAAQADVILPPYPMLGPALFIERAAPGARQPAGLIRMPELRLSVRHVRNDYPGQAGKARFALTSASLTGCPIAWRALRGCAQIDAGALDGRGAEIADPQSDRSFWVAAGALLRAKAPIGAALFFEATVGLMAPLRRAGFKFDRPTTPVGRVPALTTLAALSIGVTIP